MKYTKAKQCIYPSGNTLICITEINGVKTEVRGFMYDDFVKNISLINRLIDEGKDETIKKLETDSITYGASFLYEISKQKEAQIKRLFDAEVKKQLEGVYKIKNVVFNNPATIVFWSDGTKTVVKAKDEPFDKEKGLAMAFMKKHLGNKGKYFDTIKKFTKEKDK